MLRLRECADFRMAGQPGLIAKHCEGKCVSTRDLLSRRNVWLWGACRDRWIFLQALLQINNDLHHWYTYPRACGAHVALFFQIVLKIDNFWQWKCHRRIIHIDLPDEVHLPVVPLDRGHAIGYVRWESIAVGLRL